MHVALLAIGAIGIGVFAQDQSDMYAMHRAGEGGRLGDQ